MTYLIDTSAYSQYARGEVRFRDILQLGNRIIMPWIVVGELRAGFQNGNRYDTNDDQLLRFLAIPAVELVGIRDRTTHLYSQIYAMLKRNGKPIGTNDIWIAATAMEYDAELVTFDSDFRGIEGLIVASIDYTS